MLRTLGRSAVSSTVVSRLRVRALASSAGIRERVEAEAKGPDASEIPHKPWHWKDSQKGVLVTALAGVGCYAVIAWWFRGKEAQKPDLSRAASGDPITGTQNQTSSSTPRGPSFSK